jgi:hypothetical protein
VAGDKDYRNVNVSHCKLALAIEAAQSMQSDVQDKTTGRTWLFSMQEGFSRVKALDVQTYSADEKLKRRAYRWVIINNKDEGRVSHEGLPAAAGNVK